MPKITVLQWNVWFKENIERVLDVLKAHKTDVICLQELTKGYIDQTQENTWEYIAHELGYEYYAQEIPIITSDAQWTQANAIFSKYPIKTRHREWLHKPKDDAELTDQFRGYLEVMIDVEGYDLTVATTHMSFGELVHDDHELARLIELVESRSHRYVLTGDLNATPQTPRVGELLKRLNNAGPPLDVKTWTTKPFHFGKKEVSTLDWRYDYIFTSHDVQATAGRTVQTDVSDHLPITATITLA
jgi:endonuclease/exonuclease/phosphatase family metal-dependent hydrolase